MSTTISIDQNAIKQVAERSIQRTMDSHGITDRSQLKDEAIQSAYKHAEETLRAEAEREADPGYQQRKALEEENRLLRMQNEALRNSRPASGTSSGSTVADADIMAQKLGPAVWNHKLDGNGRLQAIGIDPAINTAGFRAEVKEYFGPGSSSMKAAELARVNLARYKLLKNAGKCLRII